MGLYRAQEVSATVFWVRAVSFGGMYRIELSKAYSVSYVYFKVVLTSLNTCFRFAAS